MKLILLTIVLSLSFSALAQRPQQRRDCSPYSTETETLIEQSKTCDAAVSLALLCRSGNRHDGSLAYTALITCEEMYGGEAALTAAQKKALKAEYRRCNQTYADPGESLFCMMEAVRVLSHRILGN